MLSIIKRTLYYFVPFTLVFFYIHTQFEKIISQSTINGLTGFYSVDALIFGLVVAFVINREWENWIKLSESVQTEINSIREMWKWSNHAPEPMRTYAQTHLAGYLYALISEWEKGDKNVRSLTVDTELEYLRTLFISTWPAVDSLSIQLFGAYNNLIEARNRRLNYSNQHVPILLKRVVTLADIILIILSLFVAVDSIFLDYLFTGAISLMVFSLLLVVYDLDNPFQPGIWQITTKDYEALLHELTEKV
jgi:hypothetical protein